MKRTLKRKEPGPGGMLVCSFLFHLVIFLIITRFNFLPGLYTDNTPVYYVDVVSLPVASPQAGTPAGGSPASVPVTEPSPPTTESQQMKLPSTKPAPKEAGKQQPKTTAGVETAQEFEERLAKLERETEARHQAAALEAARKRAAGIGKGPTGMPAATGTEAGSDYSNYIRSRLEDAFRQEDTFKPDRNKVVEVKLTIGRNGKIISKRFERSSNDIMFNNAVERAISRAERDFRPPPGGGSYEHGFVFKPQGVGKN
ncbi:energy transducer TonB [Geotalea toluenoxydans]|uniref:energy transducer TonB n=1 Tax=Geotalea toluenoxydans TaxID=421624 RepID=UPI0006D00058|nr:TonB family protein [Geotalea toluenoxydans]